MTDEELKRAAGFQSDPKWAAELLGSKPKESKLKTTVLITTIRDDGTPFGTEMEVGETAQKHVLRTFNVTSDPKVDISKVLCAALIQQMIDLRESPDATQAQKRAASIAITQIELVQMPVVKANFVQA